MIIKQIIIIINIIMDNNNDNSTFKTDIRLRQFLNLKKLKGANFFLQYVQFVNRQSPVLCTDFDNNFCSFFSLDSLKN